jgi:hypothetical protein
MRLYVVTTRQNADAIKGNGFNHSGPYYVMGEECIEKTPGPVFTDLSWHQIEDYPWEEVSVDWVEIGVDFPEDAIEGWEMIDAEGGNRRWRVPPELATRFLTMTST